MPPCTSIKLCYRCGIKTRNHDHQLLMKQNTTGVKSVLSTSTPRTTTVHRAAGTVASTIRDGPRGRIALQGQAPVHFQVCLFRRINMEKHIAKKLSLSKKTTREWTVRWIRILTKALNRVFFLFLYMQNSPGGSQLFKQRSATSVHARQKSGQLLPTPKKLRLNSNAVWLSPLQYHRPCRRTYMPGPSCHARYCTSL